MSVIDTRGYLDMDFLGRKYIITRDQIEERARLPMEDYASRVKNNVWLLYGENDVNCPPSDGIPGYTKELGDHLKKVITMLGAEHLFEGNENMITEKIVECLEEALAMEPHI